MIVDNNELRQYKRQSELSTLTMDAVEQQGECLNTYLQKLVKLLACHDGLGWKIAEEICRSFAQMHVWNKRNLSFMLTFNSSLNFSAIEAMRACQKHIEKGDQGFIPCRSVVSHSMTNAYNGVRPFLWPDEAELRQKYPGTWREHRYKKTTVMSIHKLMVMIFGGSKFKELGCSSQQYDEGWRPTPDDYIIAKGFIDGARCGHGTYISLKVFSFTR